MTKRIIIKLSGEVFESTNSHHNIDFNAVKKLGQSIKKLRQSGYQIGIVVGAGNILRGRDVSNTQADKIRADYMGMLGTIINAMALQTVLQKLGMTSIVLSAVEVPRLVENYKVETAKQLISKYVVIFAGGIGKPHFTTDTTAVIRAEEVGATHVYKCTNVAGIYSADPYRNRSATLYKNISYAEALSKKLKAMDMSAFIRAKKSNLIIRVFKYSPANLVKAVRNNNLGTQVSN